MSITLGCHAWIRHRCGLFGFKNSLKSVVVCRYPYYWLVPGNNITTGGPTHGIITQSLNKIASWPILVSRPSNPITKDDELEFKPGLVISLDVVSSYLLWANVFFKWVNGKLKVA